MKGAPAALSDAVRSELERHRAAAYIGDTGAAWWALERAHILSQPTLVLHLRVHWAMLIYALSNGDLCELIGQAARLGLAPLGSISGRIPAGNTGRSNVSAFARMPIPQDLRELLGPENVA